MKQALHTRTLAGGNIILYAHIALTSISIGVNYFRLSIRLYLQYFLASYCAVENLKILFRNFSVLMPVYTYLCTSFSLELNAVQKSHFLTELLSADCTICKRKQKDRHRQRDRETERDRERQRDRETETAGLSARTTGRCRPSIYLIIDSVEQPRNRNKNCGPKSLDVIYQRLDVSLEEAHPAAVCEELTHDGPLHHVGKWQV